MTRTLGLRLYYSLKAAAIDTYTGRYSAGCRHYGDLSAPCQARLPIAIHMQHNMNIERIVSESEREIVRRLLLAQESRDADTGVHSIRLGAYAAFLAALCDQCDTFVAQIFWAAPLHDIGKIGVPDEILKKPGGLDAPELEIMRRHTVIGARLLSSATGEVLRMAETIASAHHERYDGSGYPRALKGEDIPLAARIVSVVDFFDAVTMERCYRPRFTDEEAYQMLQGAATNHLDPTVARLFIQRWSDFVGVRNLIDSLSPRKPLDGVTIRAIMAAAIAHVEFLLSCMGDPVEKRLQLVAT